MKRQFTPDEIIFSVTEACNLKCPHCFVNKSPKKLDLQAAINFMLDCKDYGISRIGFSGGEPFLNLDFILNTINIAVENDFIFDQITTNGDWWNTEEDLESTLQKLYDSGYDGKFCLSWDIFHNQNKDRMNTFITMIHKLFGEDSLNIQCVIPKTTDSTEKKKAEKQTEELLEYIYTTFPAVKVYKMPQCFPSDNKNSWKADKWFKEDYCQGPGNIFYVFSNGSIAPCCGFANENPQLIIGNINQSYQEIMKNAENNKMVQICYQKGLSKIRKQWKMRKKIPGRCDDICTFCDWACKNL